MGSESGTATGPVSYPTLVLRHVVFDQPGMDPGPPRLRYKNANYVQFCEEICGTGIPQKTDQEIIRMIISGLRVLGSLLIVWVMPGLMSAGRINVREFSV